jgi:hypothetical protein
MNIDIKNTNLETKEHVTKTDETRSLEQALDNGISLNPILANRIEAIVSRKVEVAISSKLTDEMFRATFNKTLTDLAMVGIFRRYQVASSNEKSGCYEELVLSLNGEAFNHALREDVNCALAIAANHSSNRHYGCVLRTDDLSQ